MGVKVVLERTVRAGYENTVWEKLRDLRSQAVRARGYMYGETWRSLDNPRTFVVVSAWGTREHWEAWSNDDFRRKMDESINRMLRKPCTIRVFEEVTTLPPLGQNNSKRAGSSRRSRPLPAN